MRSFHGGPNQVKKITRIRKDNPLLSLGSGSKGVRNSVELKTNQVMQKAGITPCNQGKNQIKEQGFIRCRCLSCKLYKFDLGKFKK